MTIDQAAFNQIANTLARHFDSLYYVEIETGEFVQFLPSRSMEDISFPDSGADFFALAQENARRFVHPAEQEAMLLMYDKSRIRENLAATDSISMICRGVLNGKVSHLRHIMLRCDDGEHVICCLENIDDEIKEKEEQERNLQSAELMARRDELTGIKNKNAFAEQAALLDQRIKEGVQYLPFGIVMCDVNDLKRINDTRGHSFGDEVIQRTSRMICNVFKHSPVYRVGGDEFAVILSDYDYDHRETLLQELRDESDANTRSRSGPTVASGMAVFEPGRDENVNAVFERADSLMYENKKIIKSRKLMEGFRKLESLDTPIPDERRRLLDSLFGALYTVAGEGYVYINDMRYDFSRWSLSLIYDFGLKSQYMYHAGLIWQDYIHPDDKEVYKEAVDAALNGNAELRPIHYRARRTDGSYVLLATRCFVLSDKDGEPEYFGGIIIPKA